MLVEALTRSRLLARHCSYAVESSAAVRRVVIRKAHDVEMFPQECPEALDGEHGRLVRRRLSSDIDTDEQRSILIQNAPDLLQGDRRVRHVIERVPTDDEIGEVVEQGKILRSERQIHGSAAGLGAHEHSELLIHVEQRIDGDLDRGRKRSEVTGATTAETHDGLALDPAHVAPQVVGDLCQQQARVREPLGLVGAAKLIAPIFFVVEEPADLLQIAGIRQIGDIGHSLPLDSRHCS